MSTEEQAVDAVNQDAIDKQNNVNPDVDAKASEAPAFSSEGAAPDSGSVEAKVPQFSSLNDTAKSAAPASMSRFLDVSVQVSAELGSIKMPIGDVLQLNEGSVIELNRNLSEPVDLVAQGVRIARGEVVVIDDCFAIRIREIESNESY